MKLTAFKIKKFRSIEETKWIEVNDITNIIGVNESGKSNILLALWKFNPVNDGDIDLVADLPRDEYAKLCEDCSDIDFINTRWDISSDTNLINMLHQNCASLALNEISPMEISRYYDGNYKLSFPNLSNIEDIKVDDVITLINQYDTNSNNNDDINDLLNYFNALSDLSINDFSHAIEVISANQDANDCIKQLKEELLTLEKNFIRANLFDIEEIKQYIISHMPHFVYYSQYGNLDSDIYLPRVTEDINNPHLTGNAAAKARTLRILFSFIKLKPRDIMELGVENIVDQYGRPISNPTSEALKSYEKRKERRSILLQSASTDLTESFRQWWKQGDYTFSLMADGNFFKIWVSDKKRPAEISLESRSTGLQWFLSFYLTFLVETKGELKNSILLLDEAGLSLHPLAQKDLINFFKGLAETNQLIYTTHSPFLVDTENIDNVKLAYVAEDGHTIITDNLRENSRKNDSPSIYAVHAALGLNVCDVILQGCMPIIVEGITDQFYLNAIKTALIKNKKITPSKEMVFFPAGGAKNIKILSSVISGPNSELPYVIIDSDSMGRKFYEQIKASLYKDNENRLITISSIVDFDNAEIEDLIPFKYMERFLNRLFIDCDEDFEANDNSAILPQIETFANNNRIVLPNDYKVSLSKHVKKQIEKSTNIPDDYLKMWIKLFKKIKE